MDPFEALTARLTAALDVHQGLIAHNADGTGITTRMLAAALVRELRRECPQQLWLDLGGQQPLFELDVSRSSESTEHQPSPAAS